MTYIPDFLNTKDEEEFMRWLAFASFLRQHNSEYLTKDDRELMILNLYQLERGYQEDEDISKAKAIYRPFLSQVSENLGRLVLIKSKDYNWEGFIKNFTNRGVGANFIDIVSHDLVILERAKELYLSLKKGEIDFNMKHKNSFDKASFKVAKILFEEDQKNYTPNQK